MQKRFVTFGLAVSAASCLLATDIYNQTDLANIAGNLNGDYVLKANISLSGTWTPLGDASTPFTGTFDGGSYTISGLSVSSGSDIGLFGVTDGASITKLIVTGASVCNYTGSNVGILAGQALSTAITHVEVNGTVCGLDQVGGLVGYGYDGSVTNTASYAYVDVNGSGYNIGGLVGEANLTVVSKSFVEADVIAPSAKLVGGVVGYVTGASAYGNYFKGDINATGNFGGLVGKMEYGSVYDSYSQFGFVVGAGKGAGVVGALYESGSQVYNTYAKGSEIQGYEAGGTLGVVDTANANTSTVTCNAAIVTHFTGVKNPLKPGNSTLFNVFNNANSATALYGQTNFSINSPYSSDYNDTVQLTDVYSSGYDGLNAFVVQANYAYMSLFNTSMAACGFNSNSAWTTATYLAPFPTLVDVGPTF